MILRSRYSDSLQARQSADGISLGARFSAPVQPDPESHPTSSTIDTTILQYYNTKTLQLIPCLSRGGKRQFVWCLPPSSSEVANGWRFTSASPLFLHRHVALLLRLHNNLG